VEPEHANDYDRRSRYAAQPLVERANGASTFIEVLGFVLNTATLRRSGGAFVAVTEQWENDRDRPAGSGLQNGLLMT